jgi:hypothetical protein
LHNVGAGWRLEETGFVHTSSIKKEGELKLNLDLGIRLVARYVYV